MSHVKELLDAYPGEFGFDADDLAEAISALFGCAQGCTACADACLGEDGVADKRRCIRTCLDCADVCTTVGRVLSRQTAYTKEVSVALLEACVTVCRTCAEECERHAEMGDEHCRICAELCRQCEQACQRLLDAAR